MCYLGWKSHSNIILEASIASRMAHLHLNLHVPPLSISCHIMFYNNHHNYTITASTTSLVMRGSIMVDVSTSFSVIASFDLTPFTLLVGIIFDRLCSIGHYITIGLSGSTFDSVIPLSHHMLSTTTNHNSNASSSCWLIAWDSRGHWLPFIWLQLFNYD